ncbi:MAG: hypothetical protein ACO20H_13575 [Bacteriovoracaceae bacterium]
MSTRANIKVVDGYDELWFYRHSDGYPEGAMPTLEKFLDLVKSGKIRDNVVQACGHLIVLGRQEYLEQDLLRSEYMNWKVGAIEPTTEQHGDIEYFYTIDLVKKTITIEEEKPDYGRNVEEDYLRMEKEEY